MSSSICDMQGKSEAFPLLNTPVQKNYYEAIFHTIKELIFISDGKKVIEANRAFRSFFGCESQEELGKFSFQNAFDVVTRYGFVYEGYENKSWLASVLSGTKDTYKVQVTRNGDVKVFSITVQGCEQFPELYVTVMSEVTGLEGYKQALEDDVMQTKLLMHQYQNALEQANLVIKSNAQGFIIDANDEFCRVMKYTKEELKGLHFHTLYNLNESDKVLEQLENSLAKGEIFRGVVTNLDKYGTSLHFNLVVVPIFNAEKKLMETISVRQDITQLFEAGLEAKRTVEFRTRLLNQVSHELRTPLNAIINFVDQVLEDFDEIATDEEVNALARTYLERTMNNSKHLLNLVNTLLDVAQLNDNKQVYDMKDVYLGDVLAEAYESTVSLTKNSGVEYHFLPYQLPGIVHVDPLKLKQCLINLIGNAVKFTKEGSIKLILTKEENEYVVKVQDTGRGIEEEKLREIFDPFTQAKKGDIGTGLGLSIAKEHCHAMGIAIGVDSTVGVGTTFWLRIKEK